MWEDSVFNTEKIVGANQQAKDNNSTIEAIEVIKLANLETFYTIWWITLVVAMACFFLELGKILAESCAYWFKVVRLMARMYATKEFKAML